MSDSNAHRMDSQTPTSVRRVFPGKQFGRKPLVLDLKCEHRFREAVLAAAVSKEKSVNLTISGMAPPRESRVSVRVFLNDPEADEDTPPDDPHYVGSLSFFIDPANPEPQVSYQLQLDHVIQRLASKQLWDSEEPLQLTVFVAPFEDQMRIDDDVMVKFKGVVVEIRDGDE